MNEGDAIARMVAPGDRRNKRNGGVLQIHITRACDKACLSCTQGSNLRGPYEQMSLEQFELACQSLEGYPFTIGLFGGNCAIHRQFQGICAILRNHFPKEQCGIWCNNPLGKAAIMRETFNPLRSNLNCHLDEKAFAEFKRDWPESLPFGHKEDSRHSPVFVAMKDLIDDEGERWRQIIGCEVNKFWSASIGLFRGQLRGWFCEIAMAQSIIQQHKPDYPDTGLDITKQHYIERERPRSAPALRGPYKWWELPIQCFSHQIKKHCHECGVPLRGYGSLACDKDGVEQISKTYADCYQPKRKDRPVQIVNSLEELNSKNLPFIEYIQGGKK